MMDALRPHSFGMALAGAGGGGFMYVISKEPNARASMEAIVAGLSQTPTDVSFHDVKIDTEGLVLSLSESGSL
jgi:fucokinase